MSVPTGRSSSSARIVFTIDVLGWYSAKTRTGPGIDAVGTNAGLMNGRKISGYENALAPSTDFAVRPGITASHVSASVNRTTIPTTASQGSSPAPERRPPGTGVGDRIGGGQKWPPL